MGLRSFDLRAAISAGGAGMALIHGTDEFRTPFLLVIPVRDIAREVSASAMAFLVAIDSFRTLPVSRRSLDSLALSVSLTPGDRSAVAVVAFRRDLSSASKQFATTIGTARNHLKSAMQKAGVHSQVELTALVAALSGLEMSPSSKRNNHWRLRSPDIGNRRWLPAPATEDARFLPSGFLFIDVQV
jgi:DNA-binding CsgD family transcriptional regulator